MAALTLRGIPDELYELLKKKAKENRRSLNGEILVRLERSLRPKRADPAELIARSMERGSRIALPPLTETLLRDLESEGRP